MGENLIEYYVYIVGTLEKDRITGPVKVGMSANPDVRLSALRTACPNKIDFVCAFGFPDKSSAKLVENTFHQVLAHKQLNGEWFALGPVEAVELMCANIRAYLSSIFDDEHHQENAFYLTGAWHAEQKAIQEKYASAWEHQ